MKITVNYRVKYTLKNPFFETVTNERYFDDKKIMEAFLSDLLKNEDFISCYTTITKLYKRE